MALVVWPHGRLIYYSELIGFLQQLWFLWVLLSIHVILAGVDVFLYKDSLIALRFWVYFAQVYKTTLFYADLIYTLSCVLNLNKWLMESDL